MPSPVLPPDHEAELIADRLGERGVLDDNAARLLNLEVDRS